MNAARNMAPPAAATPGRRRSRHRWKWRLGFWLVVLGGLIGYLGIVGLDGKFYYPNAKQYDRPEQYNLRAEDVYFETEDGVRLHGWFLPARGETRGTVVHFHGNAANISVHLKLVAWLPGEGFNLLMFDYRGYGKSAGRVTRAGTIQDGHAALDYALSRPDVQGKPLFVYGQSLGAAVGTYVAAQRPEVAAVVAESPFADYRGIAAAIARRLLISSWAANALASFAFSDGYDPIDVLGELSPRPLLVIIAENDATVYPELSRAFYDAAGEPKELWVVPDVDHLDVALTETGHLIRKFNAFIDRNIGP